jgi:F-type H+-transporting ATPase subunit b
VLIPGNRVPSWACCVTAWAFALAFTLSASRVTVADETASNAVVAGESSDAGDAPDEADGQGPAEQSETEPAREPPADHVGNSAEHGDGGHHDPYDLSHANATSMLEDPTEWRYDMALCTLAVFVVLLVLLRAVAWQPLMTGLARRESAIAARIEEAERDAAEMATQLQAYRDKLTAATQEAQEIVSRARRDAEAVAEKVRSAAAEDAVRERQRALADIESAKKVALHEIAEKGADMAVGLAGRIVRRELDPQDHAELIRETLGQFPSNN